MRLNRTAFIALVRKDLALYLANRRALLMNLVAPVLIAAFVGSLFGGSQQKPSPIPVLISDQDHSPLSARVLAELRADTSLQIGEAEEAAAVAAVTAGRVRAAIVLPAGLGEQAPGALFGGGRRPVITVHYDPSQAAVLAVVRGLLTQHLMQSVSQSVFSGQVTSTGGQTPLQSWRAAMAGSRLPADQQRDLSQLLDSVERVQRHAAAAPADAASAAPPAMRLPFETRELEAHAPDATAYNSYAHAFAGMGVQFILFTGVELGIGVLLARRLGLWKRLRAAPISRGLLLGSRIASGAITAFLLMLAIYAVAMAAFGVRVQGSWPGFIGVVAAFSLLTASFGMLIAALGKTPEATRGLTIVVTLLMVMLGGAWMPSFLFPEWLQSVSLLVPTRWALDGLEAMTWRGLDWHAALGPIAGTLGFAALFTGLAIWRFDWEE